MGIRPMDEPVATICRCSQCEGIRSRDATKVTGWWDKSVIPERIYVPQDPKKYVTPQE